MSVVSDYSPRILPGWATRLAIPPRHSVRRPVLARVKPAPRFRFDRYRPPVRWTMNGLTFIPAPQLLFASGFDSITESMTPVDGTERWRILDDLARDATRPTEVDPEAQARADEKRRQRELEEMARLEAHGRRHRATVDLCHDYVLHDVAALHGPDDDDDCMGCDGFDRWPCTTFRLVEAGVNPDAPERLAEKAEERKEVAVS